MWKINIGISAILLFSLMYFNATAQFTIEVDYYKPLEAAGGGYLEENAAYRLHCNPLRSLFVFQTGGTTESAGQLDDGNFELTVWRGDKEHWVYKDFVDQELQEFLVSIQDNKYIIDDRIHPMQWQILQETKMIEGISVTKAKCEHRGRTYTAWFAPSIPISNGPWKLGGLPGLILEAYDDEKEVVFLFKSLRQLEEVAINKPASRGRQVSLATFLELNQQETKQYFEFMEARMKSTSGDFDIDFNVKYTSWESLK
jgi:GLPGLI family protein